MGGYIANFTVYTMAMIGLIFFAVFVYKKFTDGSMRGDNTKFLSVEDSMSLSPRKTLHIVRAGNEKFLIASDVDRTTLISKLSAGGKDYIPQDLERFKNIELEENYRPVEDFYNIPNESVKVSNDNKIVHFEPISQKNPNSVRSQKGLDRRAAGEVSPAQRTQQNTKNSAKTVTLDFETPKNHGFSTMKEMAMKINEL